MSRVTTVPPEREAVVVERALSGATAERILFAELLAGSNLRAVWIDAFGVHSGP
jgi:hypothetical protein